MTQIGCLFSFRMKLQKPTKRKPLSKSTQKRGENFLTKIIHVIN